MFDRNTGKPRGFGFITFSNEQSVDLVLRRKNDHQLKGKWVDCKRATPKTSFAGPASALPSS